jgi:hypothetical protein
MENLRQRYFFELPSLFQERFGLADFLRVSKMLRQLLALAGLGELLLESVLDFVNLRGQLLGTRYQSSGRLRLMNR